MEKKLIFCSLFYLIFATTSAAQKRPLIFVPGLLSSTIETLDGQILWDEDIPLFNKKRFYQVLNLPSQTWDISPLQYRHKIISHFKISHWLNIHFDRYDSLIKHLNSIGYLEKKFLNLYAYDWRRPLPPLVEEFHEYLKNNFRGQSIDILGESLGALLTLELLYLKHDHYRIQNVILLSPPTLGSPVAHRVFLTPPRKGFRISALVPQDLVPQMRIFYYLFPEKPLWRTRGFMGHDFLFNPTHHPSKKFIAEMPWVDPQLQQKNSDLVEKGLSEAKAYKMLKNSGRQVQQFPSTALVAGANCHDTFGVPGDRVVTAQSIEHTASLLKVKAHWYCEKHENLPSNAQLHRDIKKILEI